MTNKKIKNGIFYVVISLVIVLGVGGFVVRAYSGGEPTTVIENQTVEGDFISEVTTTEGEEEQNIGAFPGGDIYSDINIFGNLTSGGGQVLTTTTDTAATLAGKDLLAYSFIEVLNGSDTSDVTYTLPATSTMIALLPEIGSTREWTFHNATTSDESESLIFAAGTGMDLLVASSSDSLTIAKGAYGKVTCTRIPYISAINENIMCDVSNLFAAD